MCACVPGSTCNYHNYKFWSREKKDAFNARRRAAYHAKKVQSTENNTSIPNLSKIMGGDDSVNLLNKDSQVSSTFSSQNQIASLMSGEVLSSGKPQTVVGSANWVEPGSDPRTDESILYERRATRERMSKLSERQREILDEYKSHEHDRFNNPLSKNPATPVERAELKAIVSELEKGNESRNLWRGESPRLGTTINDLLERFPEGEKISWGNRFVSTSSSPKMAERFTGSIGGTEGILIKFEETVKGAAIFHGDKNDGELETLMSGDSEFIVKSKVKEMVYGSPQWVITLTDA